MYVYLVSAEINKKKCYKIGYTKRTVEERVKEFRTGNASEFEIIDFFTSQWGTKIEAILKRKFSAYNISGEWFLLPDEHVCNFNKYCSDLHNNFNLLINNNTFLIDKGSF